MRKLRSICGALIVLTSPSHAAVIFHSLPEPMEIFNSELPIDLFFPFDVDGNGTTDFSFTASGTAVGLRTERGNRLVITIDPPPNLGGPVASLSSGSLIGLNSLAQGSRWISSDVLGGFVSPDELTTSIIIQLFFSGYNSQFTERSAIGIEFEAEDGIHYGYFDISPSTFIAPRIKLHGWAWDTEPGRVIRAGQVPEPSSLILVGVTTASILSRRRRK